MLASFIATYLVHTYARLRGWVPGGQSGVHQISNVIFSHSTVLKSFTQLPSLEGEMVRLKNRYLLVNILYPELDNQPKSPNIPDVVVFNQPTTSSLTASALIKGLKQEVADLFGDYGSGAIADRLVGKIYETCK